MQTNRDLARIAQQRLRNQRIIGPGFSSPEDVVAWMGAVQAQEYGPAKWALGLRSKPGVTEAAVERAIIEGRILRTHVLRPTWHFVTPQDIRWMLELTAPQVHRRMATYDVQLELTPSVMTRAVGVIERALGDGAHLTRAELGAELQRAGLPGKLRELAHIMMHAELKGVICSGARRGKQFTYAHLEHRAPAARKLPRDEALAELTTRYLRSHGPATVRDYVWWSGLKTTDAKRGMEMSGAKSREVDGLKYWSLGPFSSKSARPNTTVHLLPVYDEYLVAYRDQQAVPRPAYTMGSFHQALVIGGQVAGSWRASSGRGGVTVQVTPHRHLAALERRALTREVTRYEQFLGVAVTLRV
jgi:Winged helix DNA-binding domain